MKEVVIVVPVYRTDPPMGEQASFRQCLKVLGHYDIVLLTYKELDCSLYETIAANCSCSLRKEFFDARYFKSVAGYNKLCLNPDFYSRFLDYRYMLIYQLDAWVFKDELLEWCKKDYDFVGAPWFEEDDEEGYTYEFCDNIGNGGFSLRKVSFCYKVLKRCRKAPIFTIERLWRDYRKGLYGIVEFLKRIVGIRNNLAYILTEFDGKVRNEDGVFTLFRDSYVRCRIPAPKEAIAFSFEVHPSYLFSMNNHVLPFGCHAYRKFEYDTFWHNYINDEVLDNNGQLQ